MLHSVLRETLKWRGHPLPSAPDHYLTRRGSKKIYKSISITKQVRHQTDFMAKATFFVYFEKDYKQRY